MTTKPGELTLRALVLGAAITLVFTAANVYLGLRAGLTFASAIPAAVISMAVLRALRTGSIVENNIVQTVASAAGTLSAIIFVLPGLVIVGWWSQFPFWTSFAICACGGILGVMFSIPLRRALVERSSLPYPEGVAAAEVLKVGAVSGIDDASNRRGLRVMIVGALTAAGYVTLAATRLCATELAGFFRIGGSASGASFGASFALLGAGHLVGLPVGMAMLAGVAIAWGVATPVLTAMAHIDGSAADVAQTVWRTQVRLIGAGAIGVAAIAALLRLAGPLVAGLTVSLRDGSAAPGTVTGRDIPGAAMVIIGIACLIPLGGILERFISDGGLSPLQWPLLIGALVFIVLAGFCVATVSGYMAGLIGSSNSPLSGVGILAAVIGSVLAAMALPGLGAPAGPALVAFTLLVVSIVFSTAAIANDNLQDLKTGQLVGATPWRQQVALIVGVIAGAVVIPPVLNLLNHAYGFAGAPAIQAIASQPLPAPQATLISTLATGVLSGELEWRLIGIGALLGVGLVVLDESLGAAQARRLPPLAVAMGIYLPMATVLPIVLGAMIGRLYERQADRSADPDGARRLGVLLASGFIVGESLLGVLLAALIVGTGNEMPLALAGDDFAAWAQAIGIALFAVLATGLYVRLIGHSAAGAGRER